MFWWAAFTILYLRFRKLYLRLLCLFGAIKTRRHAFHSAFPRTSPASKLRIAPNLLQSFSFKKIYIVGPKSLEITGTIIHSVIYGHSTNHIFPFICSLPLARQGRWLTHLFDFYYRCTRHARFTLIFLRIDPHNVAHSVIRFAHLLYKALMRFPNDEN